MFRNGQKPIAPLYKKDDDDGDSGGGGGDTQTFTPEQVEAKIAEARAAAVAEATKGLDEKNKELLGKLKQTKTDLERWGDLDPDQVKTMLTQFESNEEMKLLAEGKTDEVINRRMEKVAAQYESKLENLTAEQQAAKTQLERANTTIRDLLIDSRVVTAFNSEKGLEGAVPDVVLRAKSVFKVEDGEVVARDEKGELIRGKDGVLTITEWVSKLKESAPHLFPGSGGGDASGGRGRAGGGASVDDAMIEAASKGDMKEYRKLRDAKEKARVAANER